MFTLDTTIQDLQAKRKDLARLFFSMNNHQVATPEGMLEEARSFVLFFREGAGRFSAYVELHLVRTGRMLHYSYSDNPFPEEDTVDVEEDARSFAEDLGALLDELDIAGMTDGEKTKWLTEHEVLVGTSAPVAPAPEKTPGEAAASASPVAAPAPQAPPAAIPAPEAQPAAAAPAEPSAPEPAAPAKQQTPVQKTSPVAAPRRRTPAGAAAPQPPKRPIPPPASREQQEGEREGVVSPNGLVKRGREALARLFASF